MADGANTEVKTRPLWRRIYEFPLVAMLIAIGAYMLALMISGILDRFVVPATPGLSVQVRFGLVALLPLLLVYVLIIARLGERPHNDFRDAKALRRLLIGLAAGAVVFSAATLIAAAMGIYRIVGIGDLSGLFAAFAGSAVFPAVSEEMLFRGVLFRWLEEFGGSWLALLLTSMLFGAAHLANPNASVIAAVGIALEAGVMLGAAYMLTRSLWLPMGIHAAWNFTQGEIYDIPVSGMVVHGVVDARLSGPPLLTGNGFGLEASLIAIVVATLFGLWLLWLAMRKGEVRPHWWAQRRRIQPVAEVPA